MVKNLKHIRDKIRAKYPNNKIARYREYLLELSKDCPQFWELLSEESLSDDRRIVARTPQDLFVSSPHLAETKAFRIAPGWWLDINLRPPDDMQKRVNIAERIYFENTSCSDE